MAVVRSCSLDTAMQYEAHFIPTETDVPTQEQRVDAFFDVKLKKCLR